MSTIWQDKTGLSSTRCSDRRNIRAHHRVVGVSPSSACDCLLIRLLHAGRRQTDPMLLRLISSYFMAPGRAFCNRKKGEYLCHVITLGQKRLLFIYTRPTNAYGLPTAKSVCRALLAEPLAPLIGLTVVRREYSAGRRASQASDPMTFGHGQWLPSQEPPASNGRNNNKCHFALIKIEATFSPV